MQLFKSNRADVFKRGMSPNPVVEALYELEDGLSGLCARLKEREINALDTSMFRRTTPLRHYPNSSPCGSYSL